MCFVNIWFYVSDKCFYFLFEAKKAILNFLFFWEIVKSNQIEINWIDTYRAQSFMISTYIISLKEYLCQDRFCIQQMHPLWLHLLEESAPLKLCKINSEQKIYISNDWAHKEWKMHFEEKGFTAKCSFALLPSSYIICKIMNKIIFLNHASNKRFFVFSNEPERFGSLSFIFWSTKKVCVNREILAEKVLL